MALAYSADPMSLTVATWNINSVRLRIGNVERFLRLRKPDVLCLQETKCPDEFFPHQPFEALGYTHRLVQGMKSYNGVAILSKVPFTDMNVHHRCGKEDCRHIEVALDVGGDPILLDNLYIPAGGDIPDPEANVKFAHKLDFYREMAGWFAERKPAARQKKGLRRIAVGDLNVAPLEHDVWSHKQLLKIVSHTPVEVELFGKNEWRRWTGSTCRAASCPTARSSIRGGAIATTTGASPTAAAASTTSWPARRWRFGSAVIISTSICATGSSHRTMCRCWRRSKSKGDTPCRLSRHPADRPDRGPAGAVPDAGTTPRGVLVTIVIGIAGSVLATYGGQALGIYRAGETAGFIGSVFGASSDRAGPAVQRPLGMSRAACEYTPCLPFSA